MHSKSSAVQINTYTCNRCGLCVQVCDNKVLELCQDGAHVEHPELCGGCGVCEELCPEGAITCQFAITWDPSSRGEINHAG